MARRGYGATRLGIIIGENGTGNKVRLVNMTPDCPQGL